MSIVANNIKYLRRMNGLTQEQFARKIGIKRSLLGAYEEGRANPNLDNLMNIAKIFGTTTDNLLKNDIRRVRETQGVPLPQPARQLLLAQEPEPPKPLSNIIEKFYRQPMIRQVPQKVAFRPVKAAQTLTTGPSRTYASSATFTPRSMEQEYLQVAAPIQSPPDRHKQAIEWVSQKNAPDYLNSYAYTDYLKQLPEITMPMLPPGKYRAFEVGDDFPFAGATVVGQSVDNWYDIRDGQHYILVVHKQGILYRRVYNQVKIKGALLLASDLPNFPSFEIFIKDVLEIWEAKAFISRVMPEPKPTISLDRLSALTHELQREVERLNK
jgi:transcriptional regulator with XRE-family HTH domain